MLDFSWNMLFQNKSFKVNVAFWIKPGVFFFFFLGWDKSSIGVSNDKMILKLSFNFSENQTKSFLMWLTH